MRCDPVVVFGFSGDNNVLLVEMRICRSTARKQKRSKETVRTRQMIALIAEQKKPLKEYDENLFDLTVKEIRIS